MTHKTSVKVEIRSSERESKFGEIWIQEYDSKSRSRRALKWLGICWAAAIGSVVIPLAHFVLVPGFFLAGPIIAMILYGKEKEIVGGSGICPSCGKSFIAARGSVKWPYSDVCGSCHRSVSIQPVEMKGQSATSGLNPP